MSTAASTPTSDRLLVEYMARTALTEGKLAEFVERETPDEYGQAKRSWSQVWRFGSILVVNRGQRWTLHEHGLPERASEALHALAGEEA